MATYTPPEGYTLDETSGKYYSSATGADPETGAPVQWVTWFDAMTGEYEQYSYPMEPAAATVAECAPVQAVATEPAFAPQESFAPQSVQPLYAMQQPQLGTLTHKKKKKWPAVVVSLGLVVLLAGGAVLGNMIGWWNIPFLTGGNRATFAGASHVAIGDSHMIGIQLDGTVVATGSHNEMGRLDVGSWRDVVSVAVGQNHSVGLMSDGTVVATGQHNVGDWRDVTAIVAGAFHTVGLRNDGTVVAEGLNNYDQNTISQWRDIVAITAGHSCVTGLTSRGTVVTTGHYNVDDWRDVVAISAGSGHLTGLRRDGTVAATIAGVEGWQDIVSVATGNGYTAGLLPNGTVVATGVWDNRVANWQDVVAIDAGPYNIVAITENGRVVVEGYNQHIFDMQGWVLSVAGLDAPDPDFTPQPSAHLFEWDCPGGGDTVYVPQFGIDAVTYHNPEGVLVSYIHPGGTASQAWQLQNGDIITAINNSPIRNIEQLFQAIDVPYALVWVTIFRHGVGEISMEISISHDVGALPQQPIPTGNLVGRYVLEGPGDLEPLIDFFDDGTFHFEENWRSYMMSIEGTYIISGNVVALTFSQQSIDPNWNSDLAHSGVTGLSLRIEGDVTAPSLTTGGIGIRLVVMDHTNLPTTTQGMAFWLVQGAGIMAESMFTGTADIGTRAPMDDMDDPAAPLEMLIPRTFTEFERFNEIGLAGSPLGLTPLVGNRVGVGNILEHPSSTHFMRGTMTVVYSYILDEDAFRQRHVEAGWTPAQINSVVAHYGRNAYVGDVIDMHFNFSESLGQLTWHEFFSDSGPGHNRDDGGFLRLSAFESVGNWSGDRHIVHNIDHQNGFIAMTINHTEYPHRVRAMALSFSFDAMGRVQAEGWLVSSDVYATGRNFFYIRLISD